MKGFSPVWTLVCFMRTNESPKDFSYIVMVSPPYEHWNVSLNFDVVQDLIQWELTNVGLISDVNFLCAA